jgi:hypothetical protein
MIERKGARTFHQSGGFHYRFRSEFCVWLSGLFGSWRLYTDPTGGCHKVLSRGPGYKLSGAGHFHCARMCLLWPPRVSYPSLSSVEGLRSQIVVVRQAV